MMIHWSFGTKLYGKINQKQQLKKIHQRIPQKLVQEIRQGSCRTSVTIIKLRYVLLQHGLNSLPVCIQTSISASVGQSRATEFRLFCFWAIGHKHKRISYLVLLFSPCMFWFWHLQYVNDVLVAVTKLNKLNMLCNKWHLEGKRCKYGSIFYLVNFNSQWVWRLPSHTEGFCFASRTSQRNFSTERHDGFIVTSLLHLKVSSGNLEQKPLSKEND